MFKWIRKIFRSNQNNDLTSSINKTPDLSVVLNQLSFPDENSEQKAYEEHKSKDLFEFGAKMMKEKQIKDHIHDQEMKTLHSYRKPLSEPDPITEFNIEINHYTMSLEKLKTQYLNTIDKNEKHRLADLITEKSGKLRGLTWDSHGYQYCKDKLSLFNNNYWLLHSLARKDYLNVLKDLLGKIFYRPEKYDEDSYTEKFDDPSYSSSTILVLNVSEDERILILRQSRKDSGEEVGDDLHLDNQSSEKGSDFKHLYEFNQRCKSDLAKESPSLNKEQLLGIKELRAQEKSVHDMEDQQKRDNEE